EKDSTSIDKPGQLNPPIDPYQMQTEESCEQSKAETAEQNAVPVEPATNVIKIHRVSPRNAEKTVIRLPRYETVKDDPIIYAHTSRILHLETNPGNALALVQQHGDQDVWLNPPPIPLTTKEMDAVFDLPYSRLPHKDA
ncbi:MAG TPA: YgiQ family radical SAM protein, partial [Methylophaga sp.]|nr:YgiQ family radical SAM protein [Methylophaga sp.]